MITPERENFEKRISRAYRDIEMTGFKRYMIFLDIFVATYTASFAVSGRRGCTSSGAEA